MTAPATPLPSRTGPILMIVFGTLMMIFGVIIGLIMSALAAFSSLDLDNFSAVENGSSIVLQEGSSVLIMDEDGEPADCTLNSGGVVAPTSVKNGLIIHTAEANGTYTLDCRADGTLVMADGAVMDEMVEKIGSNAGSIATPFLIGLVVSLIGLILLIVGIVKLVRVNRRRRELMAGPGQGPAYGQAPGYGQGAPGGDHTPYAAPSSQDSNPFAAPGADLPRRDSTPPTDTEPPRYGVRIDPNDPNNQRG
ncbi:MAG: hypothetical protein Q4P36_03420 [Bowdeniella nasicola]|nr:hypothetical protein [Bowdeniella nasicola]